jgi:serine protease Do
MATRRCRLGRAEPICAAAAIAVAAWLCCCLPPPLAAAQARLSDIIESVVQPKIVKVYGAGGLRGLEAYQSGFLISPNGHVLTAWSHVLDSDLVTVTLLDGRRRQGDLVGVDPVRQIAVLKIDVADTPHFDLAQAVSLEAGDQVLAFSNLFGIAAGNEPASVLHGRVSVKTTLAARRGAFQTPYDGPVYILDAMTNNPGAAGGALTDVRGGLAAMLGKELRSSLGNTWLNYALPMAELRESVEAILAGQLRPARPAGEAGKKPRDSLTLALLGIVLVPDVLPRTPPFIDRVRPDSPADRAGLRPDDLVLLANQRPVGSRQELLEELSYIDRIDQLRLLVQRGPELIEVLLAAPGPP